VLRTANASTSRGHLQFGIAVALLSIGWRSFFQIQDQRQNSADHKHDRDQQHRRLPGSQHLNVSGQRPLQHNLSAQVRLRAVERGFVEIKLAQGRASSEIVTIRLQVREVFFRASNSAISFIERTIRDSRVVLDSHSGSAQLHVVAHQAKRFGRGGRHLAPYLICPFPSKREALCAPGFTNSAAREYTKLRSRALLQARPER
jgi:hypothetical protein